MQIGLAAARGIVCLPAVPQFADSAMLLCPVLCPPASHLAQSNALPRQQPPPRTLSHPCHLHGMLQLLACITFQFARSGLSLAPDRSSATLERAAAEMDRMLEAFLRWEAAVRWAGWVGGVRQLPGVAYLRLEPAVSSVSELVFLPGAPLVCSAAFVCRYCCCCFRLHFRSMS